MKLPSNLQTGDIVLFSGRCLISNIIKLFTLCRWSHVGMIIIDDRYNEPLLYESTHNDSIPCIDLGFKTKGVQVVRLADRLKQYNGSVGVRRLRMTERNDTVKYKTH
jgi:pyrimidine operon attenuation protein/uracil phosphoribosyltransferase